jgi:ABC-type transport system involved in multi-copper enzyme maturation permease subunit
MTALWPLALITFKEGTRNRAFYGISLIALLLMGATFLISGMIMRDVGKVAVDLALSTVSFTGLLLVLFVGIDLMAKDLDKRTIYMVLARPISRQQYIVGKFLGISLLIATTVFLLSFFGAISISAVKWANPGYFPRFSWGPVLLAEAFTALSLILLSSLSFLFASFSSTSFITFVLTISSYFIGRSLSDVKALVEAPQAAGISVSPLTVKVVQAAYYIFPNLSLFDIKTQAAHGLAIPLPYICWTFFYGIVYTCLIIVFAAFLFTKKEFP